MRVLFISEGRSDPRFDQLARELPNQFAQRGCEFASVARPEDTKAASKRVAAAFLLPAGDGADEAERWRAALQDAKIALCWLPERGSAEAFARLYPNATLAPLFEGPGFMSYAAAVLNQLLNQRREAVRDEKTELENEALRAMLERASEFLFILDEEMRVVYRNNAASAFMQCCSLGASSDAFADCLTDNSRVVFTDEAAAALRERGEWSGTLHLMAADESILYAQATLFCLPPGARQGAALYAASMRDISQEVMARAQLKASEARYRLLAENSRDMITLNHPDGRAIYISPAAKSLLGYDPEELFEMDPYSMFHPDDIRHIREDSHKPVLKDKEQRLSTYRMRRKDGSWVWLETVTTAVCNEAGDVTHLQTSSRDITQRKETEERLKQLASDMEQSNTELIASYRKLKDSEQKLRALIENLPVIITLVSKEGDFLFCQGRALNQFNVAPEQIEGRHIDDVLKYYPELRRQFREALETGGGVVELEADGRLMETTFIGLRNVQNVLQSLLSISFDTTERNKAARELAFQQRLLKSILDNLPFNMLLKDVDEDKVLFVNKEAARFLDQPQEEIIGQTGVELVRSASAAPLVGRNVRRQRVDFRNIPIPNRVRTNYMDGGRIFIDAGANRPRLQLSYAIDVTEKQHAVLEIKKQKQFYQQVFNTDPNMIYVKDADGQFVLVNQGFADFYGKTIDAILEHKDVESELYANEIEYVKDIDRQVLETGVDKIVEEPAANVRGENRWLLTHKRPLVTDAGERLILGISIDITDRKKNEQELRAARANAEESMRVRERFLANMSHEIRTPLNGVIGLSNMLAHTRLDEEQQSYLNAIRLSADNLLVIINDILDFSKIEAGKIHFEHIDFSLNSVLNGLEDTFALKLAEQNNDFAVELPDDLPSRFNGDPVRLNQILLNLVGNAVKFTKDGKIKLRIAIAEQTEQAYKLRFSVVDNGIGIAAERLPSIFESFTQAEDTISREFGGTGLGLSIVKQLVELQNGKIEVESELGEGSAFTFELTFGKAVDAPATQVGEERERKEIERIKNANILLVEDNSVNQLVATETLKRWLVEVDVAGNGREALDALRARRYDLVLMDIRMPVMDGYQTIDYIRNRMDAPVKDVPIMAMTAHAMPEERDKCFKLGVNDYITKPFEARILKQKISALLEGIAPDDMSNDAHLPDPNQNAAGSSERAVPAEGKNYGLKFFREIAGDDEEQLLYIVNLTIEELVGSINKFEAALGEGAHETIMQTAHKLKSTMRYLCADEAGRLFEELERKAESRAPLETLRRDGHASLEQARALYRELASDFGEPADPLV